MGWTLKQVEDDDIELIDTGDGLCCGIIVGITPKARALVGAAPDLLDELSNLVRCIERDNLHTTHGVKLARAKELISKAKGAL